MWRGVKLSGSKPFGISTQRSGSIGSSRSARSTWVSDSTMMRSHRAAQPRIRSAQAGPYGQRFGSRSIASSISSSVPCRWPTIGTSRRDARGRLIDRRQVVQVQDVGIGGVDGLQRARPGRDLMLGVLVVEAARRCGPGASGRSS